MTYCDLCHRPIRFWQKTGKNSSWHEACSNSWESGYSSAKAFAISENHTAGMASPWGLYSQRMQKNNLAAAGILKGESNMSTPSAPLPTMTLGEQQRLFAKKVGMLISYIYSQGYEVTLDWCYRPPEVAAYYASIGKGIRSSLHTQRLAIDLNLFKDGAYLSATEDHRPFGEWWCKQHELCRWGGNFTKLQDGNHYSMEYGGIQ